MTEAASNVIMMYDLILSEAFLTGQGYTGKKSKVDPATGQPIGKFLAKFILPETHPQMKAFQALMKAAVIKKFTDKAEAKLVQIKANNKFALHRGDIDRAGQPEYAGKFFISSSNAEQPTIIVTENGANIANRGTEPRILTASHPKWPYNGAKVNAQFEVFAYQNDGEGVSAKVLGIQFVQHGTRLKGMSASVASAGEFKPVVNDADSEPPATDDSGSDGLI